MNDRQPANRDLTALRLDECLTYLRAGHVGRVGLIESGRPRVFVVNYAADDTGRIVFRTSPISPLHDVDATTVTFEVDGVDELSRTGWTVEAFCKGREITHEPGADAQGLRELPVEPWAAERTLWFLLVPTEMIGRRLVVRTSFEDGEDWFAGIPSS